MVSTGAMVTPSTTLASFRSAGKLKLDFSVPEKYSGLLRTGMNVGFTLNNIDKTYNAKIIATETGIDKNTRNLKIRAEIKDPDPKLITGSFATVNIKLRENKDAVLIPTQAIIPTARNKSVLISENGVAVLKEVKTGVRKPAEIEITEGLKEGDTIITSGLLFLKDGMPVKFSNIK
jgi:membrane fusion protein (multidrug efflux system)